MTAVARLGRQVAKEFRALAFPWLGFLAVTTVPASLVNSRWLSGVPEMAYLLGAATLGALSIGHEYTDRTLGSMLAQPVRRERLLGAKLAVLALMLLALAAAADAFATRSVQAGDRLALVALPVLYGLFVAPCLTMVTRTAIGGAVFTMAAPGALFVAGLLMWPTGNGPDARAFRFGVLWYGSLALCATCAVEVWWMFRRLETIDGRGGDLRMPAWLRRQGGTGADAGTLTTRHPIWLLVAKELRLQQMTLVVAALFALGWMATSPLRARFPGFSLEGIGMFYLALLPCLSGAFASAEERGMGTLEWQLLLPVAASTQWAVKVATVVALTLLLALGLPAALTVVNPVARWAFFLNPAMALLVVFLTAAGLYVSSLCRSGLWALVVLIPSLVVAWWPTYFVLNRVATFTWAMCVRLAVAVGGPRLRRVHALPDSASSVVFFLLVAGFVIVLLRFALANHRTAAVDRWRVAKQVARLAAYAIAGAAILGIILSIQIGGWWGPPAL